MKRVVVIGLGRFGSTMAEELTKLGADVLAIDKSMEPVEQIKDKVTRAVNLDSTDEAALRAHKVGEADTVVVGLGEHGIESSILTTALLKNLNVGRIVVRASGPLHAQILELIGAHKIIDPELQVAEMISRQVMAPDVLEYVPFATGFALVELRIPPDYIGRSLNELALRQRFSVNVVAIKKEYPSIDEYGRPTVSIAITFPGPDDILQSGDILVAVGPEEGLQALEKE